MISLSKKYRTRDGHEVKLTEIKDWGEYPVRGMYKTLDGWGIIKASWTKEGTIFQYEPCTLDLVEVDENEEEGKMQIKIKKMHEDAIIPVYKSTSAAGADLYAVEDCVIGEGKTFLVKTGVSIAIPEGYCGLVQGRSGLSLDNNYHVKTGTIDSDYRGEIGVIVSCPRQNAPLLKSLTIKKGERIAQLLIMPVAQAQFIEVDELSETQRGAGGFGSTGIK